MPTNAKIMTEALPNIPWEDRPAGCNDIVWRSARNPIVGRHDIPENNSIFNSAVVPWTRGFKGIFRCDGMTMAAKLHSGESADGVKWTINPEPIRFERNRGEKEGKIAGGYDPRIVCIDGTYYVTWCNDFHGATVGVASTRDFKKFVQHENAFVPFNRNGVLFPRKINGNFALLSRPSDNYHTPYGDIFYSESPDLTFWGKHKHVMKPWNGWNWLKLGSGPVPIETSEGWLFIYHGVVNTCVGYFYRAGVALLDRKEPWRVTHKAKPYILSPETSYELTGDVPGVVFPCAALCDGATGRLALYYGAADSVLALAFAYVDELVDFAKKHTA